MGSGSSGGGGGGGGGSDSSSSSSSSSSGSSSSSCCCCCSKQLSCHKGARNYTKYVSIFISAKEVICDHVGSFACLFVCMRAG